MSVPFYVDVAVRQTISAGVLAMTTDWASKSAWSLPLTLTLSRRPRSGAEARYLPPHRVRCQIERYARLGCARRSLRRRREWAYVAPERPGWSPTPERGLQPAPAFDPRTPECPSALNPSTHGQGDSRDQGAESGLILLVQRGSKVSKRDLGHPGSALTGGSVLLGVRLQHRYPEVAAELLREINRNPCMNTALTIQELRMVVQRHNGPMPYVWMEIEPLIAVAAKGNKHFR